MLYGHKRWINAVRTQALFGTNYTMRPKQYLRREPCTGSLFIFANSENILYKIKKTTGIMKSV